MLTATETREDMDVESHQEDQDTRYFTCEIPLPLLERIEAHCEVRDVDVDAWAASALGCGLEVCFE